VVEVDAPARDGADSRQFGRSRNGQVWEDGENVRQAEELGEGEAFGRDANLQTVETGFDFDLMNAWLIVKNCAHHGEL
jgi:hypothetical protein